MTVKRNTSGLRRGPATAEQAKKFTSAGLKARETWKKDLDRAEELARIDPDLELEETAAQLSRTIRPLLREIERNPKTPDRNLIDLARELRQTYREVADARRARADSPNVEVFLSQMEDRLGQANLGEGPAPVVEHPSRPG